MKISYNWLKSLLDFDTAPQEVADLLTSSGLEVEAIEQWQSLKGGLKGLVTGKVITCEKHPDADRLSITTVDVGEEVPLNIVCGAPNVAAGQIVIIARVGATLFPISGEPFVIKKSKIRGQDSEGMICAEDEIGIGNSHEGILILDSKIPVGKPVSELFGIENDVCFEIGLTPNRSDAASHLGVAKELKALLKVRNGVESNLLFNVKEIDEKLPPSPISIVVENDTLCKRYAGIVLENIVVGESPQWLKNKLTAVGLRSINNVVDVTNFVMMETGQPLHSFDYDKISGKKIHVRSAHQKEELLTLDSVLRKLDINDVVISDESKAMCLAGVMGGFDSGVSSSTSTIFLESACFDSVKVRKSSKFHSLKSDSSFRFERGTDPNMVVLALKRAIELLKEVANAKQNYSAIDVYENEVLNTKIDVSVTQINNLIGVNLEPTKIEEIFSALDFSFDLKSKDNYSVSIPTSKVDVTRPADLIEEVLRIYGYDNIGETGYFTLPGTSSVDTKKSRLKEKIAEHFVSNGFFETMNLSLTSRSFDEKFVGETSSPNVSILNPLSSEQDVLRSTLLYGCLQSLVYNINRKQLDLRLFEFGKVYNKIEGKFNEKEMLAFVITGNKISDNWIEKNTKSDFFFAKSFLEQVLNFLPQKSLSINKIETNWSKQGLDYFYGNQKLASIGLVDSKICKSFGIKQEVYYMDMDWEKFSTYYTEKTSFVELTKFPAVKRDFALELEKSIQYQQIKDLAFKTEKKYLKEVTIFDVYQGENMDPNKKSYAVSFLLKDEEGTLNDSLINSTMEKLRNSFEKELKATLR